jgi:hypothetical protein
VCRPGREPIEITGGDLIRVDVEGELKVTRMEFRHFTAPMKGQTYYDLPGEYYSVDGYWLRAAIGAEG